MNDSPFITSLSFYPIKSCKAVELESAYVGPRGFISGKIGDRSWMVVDANGRLVSQREKPDLARVKVQLMKDKNGIPDRILISADNREPLILDPMSVGEERQSVIIHGKETVSHIAPQHVSRWFKDFLADDVTVVYQKENDIRLCDPNFASNPETDAVSFADGFQYLVTTEATLQKLNESLENPVPMTRFRPNIVIGNTRPEAEYTWRSITAGDASLNLVKPCTRCVMTTIDQDTGERTGNQPLATLVLTNFLAQDFGTTKVKRAIFGENALPTVCGQISVGDVVRIIEEKPIYSFVRRAASPRI